jgi:hypothetical protein
MNKFQKLSQISKDIELLEAAGKIKAAEILHNKFIKESQQVKNVQKYQARPGNVNQRIEYPGVGNAFERGDNFARSERGGVGTLYNFKGLEPEMELATVPDGPGRTKQVLIPKGSDPRMANPAFANAQRIREQENSIPGYNEFLRLRPQPYQIRDFMEARGTSTDAGTAIYNDLLSKTQGGNKSLSAPATTAPAVRPQVQPATEINPNAAPASPPVINYTPRPIANNIQPTQAPMPQTAPRAQSQVPSNTLQTVFQGLGNAMQQQNQQPVAQGNFQNYYTEQSDTANFYQQQNAMPNAQAQQESNEQRLYMNALNDIINGFASQDPTAISQAEQLYKGTLNSFKNPRRQQAFMDQIQRQRVKYLKPMNYNQGPLNQ